MTLNFEQSWWFTFIYEYKTKQHSSITVDGFYCVPWAINKSSYVFSRMYVLGFATKPCAKAISTCKHSYCLWQHASIEEKQEKASKCRETQQSRHRVRTG